MRSQYLAIILFLTFFSQSIGFKQNHFSAVGAYSHVNLNNPPNGYLKAREYALNHFLAECKNDNINSNVKLGENLQGFVQIVAGTNYKLVFKVENYSSEHLTIVVFQSLPDKERQVHYSISNCE